MSIFPLTRLPKVSIGSLQGLLLSVSDQVMSSPRSMNKIICPFFNLDLSIQVNFILTTRDSNLCHEKIRNKSILFAWYVFRIFYKTCPTLGYQCTMHKNASVENSILIICNNLSYIQECRNICSSTIIFCLKCNISEQRCDLFFKMRNRKATDILRTPWSSALCLYKANY